MQPVYATPPNSAKIAWFTGLLIGLILAVFEASILLINTLLNKTPASLGFALLLTVIGFIVGLAAYFVAGILGSRKTARVSTGTIAGLWTGAIYGTICLILSLVLFFTVTMQRALDLGNSAYSGSSSQLAGFRAGIMIGGIGGPILGLLFAIGLGAGLGALGGLVGKSMSKVPPTPDPNAWGNGGQWYPPAPAGNPGQPYPQQQSPYQPYPQQQQAYPPYMNNQQGQSMPNMEYQQPPHQEYK